MIRLLAIGGRSGCGKSTVGWAVSAALTAADTTHAFIEGDFLDAYHVAGERDPGAAEMTERNLAALWRNYAAAGVDRLVYVNTVSVLELDMLCRAIGSVVAPTAVLLEATDATARERLARREHGDSLLAHIERSDRRARELEDRASPTVARIATDHRDPDDVAHEVIRIWDAAGG